MFFIDFFANNRELISYCVIVKGYNMFNEGYVCNPIKKIEMKMMKRLFVAFFLVMNSVLVLANVTISEIMPCNISTYINDKKDFTGWIEFYNDGTSDVSLEGWVIGNYINKSKSGLTLKWSWTIDKNFIVPAGEYALMYFDEVSGSKHAPYKVDVDGGMLELIDKKGNSSVLMYSPMKPHISYGVYKETWGYMLPTPGEKNSVCYDVSKASKCQCEKPTFAKTQPGVFSEQPDEGEKETRKVTLSCSTEGAVIRYTLDGSEPTSSSEKYTDSTSIKFTSTICLRARAFKDGMLPSDILTGSFIVYENRSGCDGVDAPVVSIVTDKKFMKDSQIGIHTVGDAGIPGTKSCIANNANYNQDWHRAVNFEYFVDGKQKVSQEAMAGIMGGCSRKYDVKSLKITTSKRTGNETYGYNFFAQEKGKEDNEYASLQLRNGGNGYETVRCRDGFMQSIAKGMGNIDYQAYQPVSYYLNGTYMGFMGLRERTNEDFVFSNYGLDKDKIDVIKFTQEKPEVCVGDRVAYDEMVRFVTDSNNYKRDDYLMRLTNYMDVEEYLNYIIFEQFIVNTDWPGNNQKLWRKHVGGKFRWILYDTDFGLGLYSDYPNFGYSDMNMIKFCLGTGEKNWANADPETYQIDEFNVWKTEFFKSLMQNKEFGKMYMTKALMLLSSTLSYGNIESIWNTFYETVKKEHCVNKTVTSTYASLSQTGTNMLGFAKARNGKFKEHLAEYFGVDTTSVKLKVSCADKNTGFYINNIPVNENSVSMKCMKKMEVTLRPILPSGYVVDKWTVDDTLTYKTQSITFTMNKEKTVKLTLKEESYDKPLIFINELCSKSSMFIEPESEESSDWLELYNASDDYIEVSGFYLSDNDTTIQIASGYGCTNIPPKGFLLLWADDRGKSGAQHLGFKLSDAGETITLTKKVRDSLIVVDKVAYGTIGENNSYGRETDGASKMRIFSVCSQNTDFTEATPGEANSLYDCETILDTRTYKVNITSNSTNVRYDINGKSFKGANVTTYLMKGKTLTVSPNLPAKCKFIKWELPYFVETTKEVLTAGNTWRYHYIDSAPSGDWTALKYDDAKWSKGEGIFGYDTKEDTKRHYDTGMEYGDKDDKYITAYFRNVFTLSDTAGLERLVANMTFDDGVILYVNGKEIKRYNMPSDSLIAYSDTTPDYQDDVVKEVKIFPSDLKLGENVLAAEVHQYNGESSDLTFALNMNAIYRSHFSENPTITYTPTSDFSAKLYVEDNTDIYDMWGVDDSSISFYPNPTNDVVFLAGCKEPTTVIVYDQIGTVLKTQMVENDTQAVSLEGLSAGSYVLVATSNNEHAVAKILKK